MKLTIVIVSYNVCHMLEQCLRAVNRALEGMEGEVVVVDNASTDGSMDYLRPRFPGVRFMAGRENVGFSRANNLAIRQTEGDYVLLLNPDTLVAEDTLRQCVAFLDAHPSVGATGVRMLNSDGSFAPESRRGLPTPFTSFCKMCGLGTLFPRSHVFGRYYMRYLDVEEASPIEVISGAFCMVRRQALDQVGLLDEDFFMYGEDIDLSYRLLRGGWENYYLPCTILHYKGESTVKSSFRYVHVFYEAMLIFFNKHYGRRYRILGKFVRLAVWVRALMDMVLRLVMRVRVWMGIPERYVDPGYLVFDFDSTPVSEMLRRLADQPHGQRLQLETRSQLTGMAIRSGGARPLTEKEKEKEKEGGL